MKSKYFDEDAPLSVLLELYRNLKDTKEFESPEQEEWFAEFDEFMAELGNPYRLQQMGD